MNDPGESTILRLRLGPLWRFWLWFAGQWSTTSLASLLAVIGLAGGYIDRLSQRVSEQGTKIIVLETQVVPVLEGRRDEVLNKVQIEDVRQRVERLEGAWDAAIEELRKTEARRRRGG